MLNTVSLKLLKTDTLKLFCKNVSIKNYSKLNKQELFKKYNEYLACKIIQKHFRNHFYKNAEDSISLEPVRFPCFIYRTKLGKCFFYSYDSIIKYIMKTGDTRDPMTRNQYSDEDLARIDNEVKRYFPNVRYSSTLKIKNNINYAKRIRNRENEILNFQMYLEELKNKIIVVIESDALSWEQFGEITIDFVEYYSINDYINVLLNKIKTVYISLKNYDLFSATCFKENILSAINTFQNNGTRFISDYLNQNLI